MKAASISSELAHELVAKLSGALLGPGSYLQGQLKKMADAEEGGEPEAA